MVPNARKQTADFLNRFDLPKVVNADDLSNALSDGSLIASLLSRYYPDQIDISRLILPASTVHSKMHNWTVINDCLASPLENGQLLSLATANDEIDALEDLIERLHQVLPDQSESIESRSASPTLMKSSLDSDREPGDRRVKASRLILDAIETCEGTVRYLNEKTNLMSNLLQQLREIRDENEDYNNFDRLLTESNVRPITAKKTKKTVKVPNRTAKKAVPQLKVAKSKESKAITDKSAKRSARQKRKTQATSIKEDRILSLIGRFDALLGEQFPTKNH